MTIDRRRIFKEMRPVDRPGLFDRARAAESLYQSGVSVSVSGATFVDDPLV